MSRAERTLPDTTRSDLACRDIAAAQHGVISRAQATSAGLSKSAIWRRLRSGEWQPLLQGIYETERLGDVWLKNLMAACLKAKVAAVSHCAAAGLWQLAGIDPGALEITVPFSSSCRQIRGFRVHRTRSMPSSDLTYRGSLPITTVERSLIDLAMVVPMLKLEAALDSALRKRLTNLARIKSRIQGSETRGHRGVGDLKRLVDDRFEGAGWTESPLEARFLSIIRGAGLPQPQRQVWVKDGPRSIARVDFAYPELKLAIEIDGIEHHAGGPAMRRDRRRDNELKRLGWTVLRFMAPDLDDPDYVVALLGEFLSPPLFR